MGTIDFSKPIISTININMKLFIIAAVLIASVFAEPEAEADPNAWYASYVLHQIGKIISPNAIPPPTLVNLKGNFLVSACWSPSISTYHLKTYGYAGFPYYGAYAPYTYGAYGYAGYPYAYNGYALGTHLIGKRSADADAEAKPWLAYANYGYAGYPYAYAGAYGYPYGAYGLGYNGYALGAHYIGKGSADAEAKPEAWYGAYGYGYAGYPYSYGYAGYPYGYAGYPYAYGYGK